MYKNTINKDYYGGLLMILLGLGAILGGLRYHIGSLSHMGSGFFPTIIGTLLIFTGILIGIEGMAHKKQETISDANFSPEWRGWACILGGIIGFIVLGKYTGLLPATFAIVFISALGDKRNTKKSATILALSMCAIAVVVFRWILQLQFPLLQWG